MLSYVVGYKQTLLMSDSIAKHVHGVDGLVVEAFPGRTLGGLAYEISKNVKLQDLISKSDYVIVHCGTNDIRNLGIEDFPAAINNVFACISRINRKVKLLYSAILPRPVDFAVTKELVIKANNRIRRFCKFRKFPFLKTFKPFVDRKGIPMRHMFAIKDGGLHLNTEGSRVLSNFFLQVVKSQRNVHA